MFTVRFFRSRVSPITLLKNPQSYFQCATCVTTSNTANHWQSCRRKMHPHRRSLCLQLTCAILLQPSSCQKSGFCQPCLSQPRAWEALDLTLSLARLHSLSWQQVPVVLKTTLIILLPRAPCIALLRLTAQAPLNPESGRTGSTFLHNLQIDLLPLHR